MALHMYSTSVDATKTIGEIQALLLKHGATDIWLEANNGVVTGVKFRINTPHGNLPFALPANISKVHAVLCRDHEPRYGTMDQARRTGWRIILRWVQSQLAYIETEMVTLDQIMLPFLQVDDEASLYERFVESPGRYLALPEGKVADRD